MNRHVRAEWETALLVCGKCSKKLGGGFGDKKNRAKIILTVFKARLPKNYYPHKHRRQPNIWR